MRPLSPLGSPGLSVISVQVSPPSVAVEPAGGAAAGHAPEGAAGLPDGREKHAGIVGVHRQVGGSGVLTLGQHVLPRLAAIGGAKNTTLLAGSEGVTEGRDVDDIRVAWMDPDPGDMPRILEPQMRPGLAGVGRPVHAVAVADVQPDAGLAHPGVDHVRVRGGDLDGAYRGGLEEAVGDVLPVGPGVVGLPDPTGACPEVEDGRIDGVSGDRDDPSAARRPDAPPLERVKHILGHGHRSTSSL